MTKPAKLNSMTIEEKLKKIIGEDRANIENLSFDFNECWMLGRSVKEEIELLESMGSMTAEDWASEEERQKAIDNESLWRVTLHKNTVSFDMVWASTLDAALDHMINILSS